MQNQNLQYLKIQKIIKNFIKHKEGKLFFNYFCKDYYYEKVIQYNNNIKG